MHRFRTWTKLLVLVLLLVFPSLAWAGNLSIIDVETPEENSDAQAASLSVYFDYVSNDQTPVKGVTAGNCSISIDGKKANVVQSEIQPFVDGKLGVGVVFVFPIGKSYPEFDFSIRSHLTTLLNRFDRSIDYVTAVAYDKSTQTTGWSKASEKKLVQQISEMTNSDDIESNLFISFSPAMSFLESLKDVSQKYLVIISDGEGQIMGDPERSAALIASLNDKLRAAGVIPIVIAYSPDGVDAMSNIAQLKRIANVGGGYFYAAGSDIDFQEVLTSDVYNNIFGKYMLKTTLDMSGDNYLKDGKYLLNLEISRSGQASDNVNTKINWPTLTQVQAQATGDAATQATDDAATQATDDTSSSSFGVWDILKYLITFLAGLFVGGGIMLLRRKS